MDLFNSFIFQRPETRCHCESISCECEGVSESAFGGVESIMGSWTGGRRISLFISLLLGEGFSLSFCRDQNDKGQIVEYIMRRDFRWH